MNYHKLLRCAAVTVGLIGVSFSASARPPPHGGSSGKPIKFAEIGWRVKIFTEIARYVLEKGYGCQTETVNGSNSSLSALYQA